MNQPKVSIVIPFFNCPYVQHALATALGQTYPNIEILLVDDGSTKHIEKAEPYLQHPKVQYIRKNNGGTASALNKGIISASGDYFVWLSSDDAMSLDKVQKQLYFMQQRDAFFSFTSYLYMDHCSRLMTEPVRFKFPDKLTLYQTMMQGCPINGSSVMIRMNVFASIGMFDETLPYAHDYDLWLRMLPHYEFYYLDEPLTFYRVHEAMGTKVHEREIMNEISFIQSKHHGSILNLINSGEV